MVARVVTVAFDGVDARRVDVEVQQVGSPAGAFAIVTTRATGRSERPIIRPLWPP